MPNHHSDVKGNDVFIQSIDAGPTGGSGANFIWVLSLALFGYPSIEPGRFFAHQSDRFRHHSGRGNSILSFHRAADIAIWTKGVIG
jgi:hypothetical protein